MKGQERIRAVTLRAMTLYDRERKSANDCKLVCGIFAQQMTGREGFCGKQKSRSLDLVSNTMYYTVYAPPNPKSAKREAERSTNVKSEIDMENVGSFQFEFHGAATMCGCACGERQLFLQSL